MAMQVKQATPGKRDKAVHRSASLTKLLAVFIAVALTASMALALLGCGDNGSSYETGSSGSAQIANPVVEVEDVAAVNDQLNINLVVPQEATIESSSIIDNSLGAVVFTLENQKYTYRGLSTDESEDISGLYFDFTSLEEGTLGDLAYLIEYNDGGPGYSRWFDDAAGITYSVSVDTGASKDKLTNIATLLIAEQSDTQTLQ